MEFSSGRKHLAPRGCKQETHPQLTDTQSDDSQPGPGPAMVALGCDSLTRQQYEGWHCHPQLRGPDTATPALQSRGEQQWTPKQRADNACRGPASTPTSHPLLSPQTQDKLLTASDLAAPLLGPLVPAFPWQSPQAASSVRAAGSPPCGQGRVTQPAAKPGASSWASLALVPASPRSPQDNRS